MKKNSMIILMALMLIGGIGAPVYALEGPVDRSDVGITVTPGWNPLAMGQPGGSDETFSNFDVSEFLEVYFRAVDIVASVNGDWTDSLSFSGIQSNKATWTGESDFTYFDYYGEHNIVVPTRLTITSDRFVILVEPPLGTMIQLRSDAPVPTNFIFEAYFPDEWSYPGPTKTMTEGWYPIRWGFDQYNTLGGNLVIISFYEEFYYESVPCECDLNGDGSCDGLDWLLFYPDWGRTDCNDPGVTCECDLNGDGNCDGLDWLIFYPDWGRTDCPIP